MKELRAGIIRLFEQGKSGRQIAKDMNLPQRTVSDAIKRFQETGSNKDRARSGRPKTARTPANIRKVKGRIQRNPSSRKNSTRKMGAALDMSNASVHNILHKDLGMKSRKEATAQNLAEANKIQKRAERCPR
jgi:transposase